MDKPSFSLFTEDSDFSHPNPKSLENWINNCITKEGFNPGQINIIFCSDEYLLEINQKHLGRDYFTDIITFDQSDQESVIEGDLYISTERIEDNATDHSARFIDELERVIIHGILHLMGFSDKSDEDVAKMREKEDSCLILRP